MKNICELVETHAHGGDRSGRRSTKGFTQSCKEECVVPTPSISVLTTDMDQ